MTAGDFNYKPLHQSLCLHASRLYFMVKQESEDTYSLTVNLRRLYQFQLAINISDNYVFTELQGILKNLSNLEDEVMIICLCFVMIILEDVKFKDFAPNNRWESIGVWWTYFSLCWFVSQVIRLVLLNMFLHLAWALKSVDLDDPDSNLVKEVLTKRASVMEQLESILYSLLNSWQQDNARNLLTCTVCLLNYLVATMWRGYGRVIERDPFFGGRGGWSEGRVRKGGKEILTQRIVMLSRRVQYFQMCGACLVRSNWKVPNCRL